MAGSYAVQGVSSAAGAYSQSQAQSALGTYQKSVADTNASLAETQASDAIERGNVAASRQDMKTKQVVGSQRAGLAAQGVDVNSGSAMDVQGSTQAVGALDALTIKNNAWRTAWGYQAQAENYTTQGQFEKQSADAASTQTLLTGGMQFLSSGLKAAGSLKGKSSSVTDMGAGSGAFSGGFNSNDYSGVA